MWLLCGGCGTQIPAPFKPEVKNETDVGNFDAEFTTDAPLTPPDEGKGGQEGSELGWS